MTAQTSCTATGATISISGAHSEAVERRNLGRDQTHHHPDRSTLLEQIDAIAHTVRGAVREVDVEIGLEVRALPIIHHVHGELRDGLARQCGHVAHGPQVTLDPENRRETGLQVNVRGPELASSTKDAIEDLTHRQRLG